MDIPTASYYGNTICYYGGVSACVHNVYQALAPPLSEEPGYKARYMYDELIHVPDTLCVHVHVVVSTCTCTWMYLHVRVVAA